MSKHARGTTQDANRRRERHARSERERRRRIDLFTATFGGPYDRVWNRVAIERTCKQAGAVAARIREWPGGVVVIPLGRRGRPVRPAIVQRVRAECLARKPAGIELCVLWKDDGPR